MSMTSLSVYISYLLRHQPQAAGLAMDAHGWVSVAELIDKVNAAGRYHITEAILDEIEVKIGYHPADFGYIGKTPVRASFEWQAGEMSVESGSGKKTTVWNAGAVSIDDAAKLEKLSALIKSADFTIGSVNCPSPAFMTVEYADGSSASFAVAVNSFNLFFRNGVMFTTQEDIIDIFGIRETEFYQGFFGI